MLISHVALEWIIVVRGTTTRSNFADVIYCVWSSFMPVTRVSLDRILLLTHSCLATIFCSNVTSHVVALIKHLLTEQLHVFHKLLMQSFSTSFYKPDYITNE